jgi:O-antigen/teichoic acid export membrane protein
LNDEPVAAPQQRGVAHNAVYLGLGQVVTTVLTMLFSAAIARTLGAAEFGLLYLLTSIGAFAYVFVDWGHGTYITREIARHPERSGEMIGSVLVVRVVSAVIMCALAVGLCWLFDYERRTLDYAALLILAWIPQYLGLSYAWAFRGRERMEYDALIQVVLKLSMLVFAAACLWLGGRLLGLIAVYAVAGMVTCGVAVAMYQRLGFAPLQFSLGTAVELVRDGASMMAIALAIAVQPYIDANLLYKLAPANVVGWFGAAWVVAGTLVAPATILGATLYPRLSRVAMVPHEFSHTLRTGFRGLALVSVLGGVGAFLFGDLAIGIIYGEQKFRPAAQIVQAFAPALMLVYIDMLLGYSILAIGKAGQLAKVKVASVLVTTGVELVLIPYFQSRFGNGGIGIVLAMATGELVMVAGAITLIRDVVDRAMLADFARALSAGVVTVLIVRAVPAIPAFLGIPVCLATFAALSAAVGLVKRPDVEIFSSMFRRRSGLASES